MKKNDIQSLTLTTVFAAIILVMTFVPQIGYINIGAMSELTLIHIPVLIGAFFLPKKYTLMLGAIFGIGSLTYVFVNGLAGQPVFAAAFANPLVSVFPRMIFAIVASYIFDLFKWFNKTVKNSEIYIFGFVSLVTIFAIYYASQVILLVTSWNPSIFMPISLLVVTLFMTAYYTLIRKEDQSRTVIPSTFLVATIFHTFIVLMAALIFERSSLELIAPSTNIIGFIYTVAVTNGLIEAILAVLIGTPIVFALNQLKAQNA